MYCKQEKILLFIDLYICGVTIMEEIFQQPIYAILAFSIIACIFAFRFVSPIIDKIVKSAQEKQAIIDQLDKLDKTLETHKKEYTERNNNHDVMHEIISKDILYIKNDQIVIKTNQEKLMKDLDDERIDHKEIMISLAKLSKEK